MKKILLFNSLVIVFIASAVSAHPPLEIELSYDQEEGKLHIDMRHVVRNGNDHYIRKITVTKNDEEPMTFSNRKQLKATGFTKDVSLEAQAKDIIEVKAYCSDGGSKAEVLEVEEGQKDDPAKKASEEQEGKSEKKGSGY